MHPKDQNEPMAPALPDEYITMAVESWKLARTFNNLLKTMNSEQQKYYTSLLSGFSKAAGDYMEISGLSFVSLEGQYFNPNMTIKAVNLEEFTAQDLLVIDRMLEPIVMGKDTVLRAGTVLLRKAEIQS